MMMIDDDDDDDDDVDNSTHRSARTTHGNHFCCVPCRPAWDSLDLVETRVARVLGAVVIVGLFVNTGVGI